MNKRNFMNAHRRRSAKLIFSMIALVTSAPALAALKQPIEIESGRITGIVVDAQGLQVFKGVPYAQSPTGAQRWRPPAQVHSWKGVLHADHFAPDCPTAMPLEESTAAAQSEDCLYLNVWTPAKRAAAKLPVMMWIYGSGFQGASASYKRYDGAALARKGVILVSFDYRNGILGFLTHPLLSNESAHHVSGNYGLLDVIAALQWVKRNIAAFGGDPDRITLFGQSSGSETVNLMTATPLAQGLFQRAIGESGGSFGQRQPKSLAESEREGAAFGATLATNLSLEELRAKTSAELFAAKPPRFEPVVDGWVLPHDPHTIFSEGRQNDVATLVGSNADETQLSTTLTAAQFLNQVHERYGSRADEFLKFFPAATDDAARSAAKASGTILLGDYNTTTWASLQAKTGHAAVFQYRFVHAPPRSQKAVGPPRSGAYHAAEILYVFHNLDIEARPWSNADLQLQADLSSYWVNFARTGDPNGPGVPPWPSVQDAPGQVLEMGETIRRVNRPNTPQLEFFDSVFYQPGGLYAPPSTPRSLEIVGTAP